MSNLESSRATNERLIDLALPHDPQRFTQLHGLQGLLRVVTRRWKWIVAAVVVCELLAIFVTMRTIPVYEATATIELNKSGENSLGLGNMLSGQLGDDEDSLQIDQQTETAILQGDSLALAVIQRLGLASQPPFARKGGSEQDQSLESAATRTRLLGTFKSGLKVRPVRGTRLIQVVYRSHVPEQAATIANAVIDSYKNQYLQSHYNATSEASDWLTKQLSELKTNVEDSEKKLTDFEKESGIINLMPGGGGGGNDSGGEGQIHSVVIEKLDQLNSDLTAAETNRIEKEAIYHLVQTSNDDVVLGLGKDPLAIQSNSMVLTQGGGLSGLQQLEERQNALKLSLADAQTTYGPNNRHLKEMQTELNTVNQQIQQELKEIVKRAQADFQLAQQTEDEIRRRFNDQQAAASKLNEKTVQFAVLSQEAYSRKKLYEDLYTKLQEANVSAGLKATNITVVDPARAQSSPVLPQTRSNLAFGILFGIFIGFSSAFAIDGLDRTVTDPLEVEEITGKPVIAVIPIFGEKGRSYRSRLAKGAQRLKGNLGLTANENSTSTVWMLQRPDSVPAEAFRVLRTSIMLSRAGGGLKTLLITGCAPGEGKTTITTNLAIAFAQHNMRVLIIEADMRRPKLRGKMDFPGKTGLSNVLSGTSSCEDAILQGLYVPSLDVLPAGPRPPMPSEILGSAAFGDLLEKLRARYEIILIDSPPALVVTDAVTMSPRTDAVLWVSQAGVITRPQLGRATHLIERNRIPVIGFVMNQMSKTDIGYSYGYEYEIYGSRYGEENLHDA
ncbi:MAG TPA: polysaccharide biosynthesis tyrosine autokinase [Terracidiphilus sp.]|nr:polysaccharide biosynthesis tyrosine autokinase [Terracidiphilus sp.]